MTLNFDNIFDLLESVREYRCQPKESLQPTGSVTGTHIGYVTADSVGPATTWLIPLKVAKATATARGTREADRIRSLLSSYMGRKQLLEELLSGDLSYGVVRQYEPVVTIVEVPKGPRQHLIPGL